MGLDIKLFENVDSQLVCSLCTDVALEPVSCPECLNNVFCLGCISKWLDEKESCPHCKNYWKKEDVKVSRIVQGFIEKLTAKCPYENCTFKSSYGEVTKHVKHCEFEQILCPYAAQGCSAKPALRKEINEHKLTCKYRPIDCVCKQRITLMDLQRHQEEECPSVEIPCTNQCSEHMLRKDLKKHLELDCLKRTAKCVHAGLGCAWTGKLEDAQDHLDDECVYEPVKIALYDQKRQIETLQETLASQQKMLVRQTEIIKKLMELQGLELSEDSNESSSSSTSTGSIVLVQNFALCKWDPRKSHSSHVITNNGLTLKGTEFDVTAVTTLPCAFNSKASAAQNRFYFELTNELSGFSLNVGFLEKDDLNDTDCHLNTLGYCYRSKTGDVYIRDAKVPGKYLPTMMTVGGKIGILIDMNKRVVDFWINGSWSRNVFTNIPAEVYPAITLHKGQVTAAFGKVPPP